MVTVVKNVAHKLPTQQYQCSSSHWSFVPVDSSPGHQGLHVEIPSWGIKRASCVAPRAGGIHGLYDYRGHSSSSTSSFFEAAAVSLLLSYVAGAGATLNSCCCSCLAVACYFLGISAGILLFTLPLPSPSVCVFFLNRILTESLKCCECIFFMFNIFCAQLRYRYPSFRSSSVQPRYR